MADEEEEEEDEERGTHSSDLGERTEDTSLTSRNIERRSSLVLRLSRPVESRSFSNSSIL